VLEASFLEALCRANAPDRSARRTCLDIVRTVLLPAGSAALPPSGEAAAIADGAIVGSTQETPTLRVTLLDLDWEPEGLFAAPGFTYAEAEFDFQSKDDSAFVNQAGLTAVDEEGYAYDSTCGFTCLMGGDLAEGRKKKGRVLFELPVEADRVAIEYTDVYGADRLVWTVDRPPGT
jgi:hypothetical protein